jgi:hypothetical protein
MDSEGLAPYEICVRFRPSDQEIPAFALSLSLTTLRRIEVVPSSG